MVNEILASKLHRNTEKNRILRFNGQPEDRLRSGIILRHLSCGVCPGSLFFLSHGSARTVRHLKSSDGDTPLFFPRVDLLPWQPDAARPELFRIDQRLG